MTTVILVPVLGRPQRVAPLIANVRATTPEPHRLLFIASADDTDELAALEGTEHLIVPPERGSYPCKMNDGYAATREPFLFLAADDVVFHSGWLSAALAHDAAVVGTNDLYNPRVLEGMHSTHTLVRRSYVEEPGAVVDGPGLVSEAYRHSYVDDELVGTAQARGVYAHAHDSIVEHIHPFAGKAERDSTYELGAKSVRADKRVHMRRRRLWRSL